MFSSSLLSVFVQVRGKGIGSYRTVCERNDVHDHDIILHKSRMFSTIIICSGFYLFIYLEKN